MKHDVLMSILRLQQIHASGNKIKVSLHSPDISDFICSWHVNFHITGKVGTNVTCNIVDLTFLIAALVGAVGWLGATIKSKFVLLFYTSNSRLFLSEDA